MHFCFSLSLSLFLSPSSTSSLLPPYFPLLTSVPRTTRSDWLAWEVAREPLERAIPRYPF